MGRFNTQYTYVCLSINACIHSFIYSFIRKVYTAPVQETYSEAQHDYYFQLRSIIHHMTRLYYIWIHC